MKKILTKVLTGVLASSFCAGAFAGCNGPSNGGGNGKFEPIVYTNNGEDIANYQIVISNSASKSTAYGAEILQKRLKQALNVQLPIVTDATAEGDLEIILGDTNRKECDGFNYTALGEESFAVKNVGNDLVIAGNDRGLLYGVYAYLEAIGFRFYTVDTEKIPYEDEVFVPENINITWSPTFDYRETMYYSTWDADWAVSQRVNSDFMRNDLKGDDKYGGFSGYIGGGKWMVHTFSLLLDESLFTSHPEYFAETNGARRKTNLAGHSNQPCLTNEGAYQVILDSALKKIASDPKSNIISISENDGGDACTCQTCQDSYDQYGVSGTFFRFINRIAKDIGAQYPNVYIDTLAYSKGFSLELPTGITMDDNVIIRVCPQMCNFCDNPKECEQLKEASKLVTDFSKICKNIYVYFYPVNWSNIFSATPSYEAMLYDINFFAESGVKGVYAEGYPLENPEFGELKAYLMAKLLQNPKMSEGEFWYHYNDFLEGYYDEAAEYIAEYHTITKKMIDENIKNNGHMKHWFEISKNFDFKYDRKTHTYDMTYIDQINELWDEAVNAVIGTPLDHVKKSRIHWTYIELYTTMDNRMLYNKDERADLMERNEELYRDILKYGTLRKFSNAYDISKSIDDFTLSPASGNWLRP